MYELLFVNELGSVLVIVNDNKKIGENSEYLYTRGREENRDKARRKDKRSGIV